MSVRTAASSGFIDGVCVGVADVIDGVGVAAIDADGDGVTAAPPHPASAPAQSVAAATAAAAFKDVIFTRLLPLPKEGHER